jgi:hypothetical protein
MRNAGRQTRRSLSKDFPLGKRFGTGGVPMQSKTQQTKNHKARHRSTFELPFSPKRLGQADCFVRRPPHAESSTPVRARKRGAT